MWLFDMRVMSTEHNEEQQEMNNMSEKNLAINFNVSISKKI